MKEKAIQMDRKFVLRKSLSSFVMLKKSFMKLYLKGLVVYVLMEFFLFRTNCFYVHSFS